MSSVKVTIGAGGILIPLLLVLFIGLKLGGVGVVAGWSWIWVLSPIWIPIALTISIWGAILLFGLLLILVGLLADFHSRKK